MILDFHTHVQTSEQQEVVQKRGVAVIKKKRAAPTGALIPFHAIMPHGDRRRFLQ